MPEPPHNPIFTRFVEEESDGDDQLPGLIAYGLYKIAKREWLRDLFDRHGRRPTQDELESYAATWTESRLRGLQEQAENALAAFASTVVDANAPGIRERALRGTTLKAVGTSIAANFVYTILLIALVIVLRAAGIDLLSVASSVGPGSH